MRSDRRDTCSLSFINYKNSKREFRRQKRRAEYQENGISDLDVATSSEVADVIKLLKTDKSRGPDMVTNEHLKYAGQSLLICSTEYYSVNIFQKFTKLVQLLISIQVRIRIEIIRQVIRGITLTTVIGKFLEKILLNRIKNTLEPKNILFPHELQFGFMENKSAVVAAYVL